MSWLPKNDLSPLLLDSAETYYWIGFILADGHYNRPNGFSITLSAVDDNHLRKLQRYIKSDSFQYLKNYNQKKHQQVRMCFNDKNLGPKIAEKFNIRRDKTYYPPNLNFIQDKTLFLSLFAGYIDGDGTIEYSKNVRRRIKPVTIRFHVHASWQPFLQWIKQQLIKHYSIDIADPSIGGDGYLRWCISNFSLIKQIKIDLDKLNIPLLQRKWDKIHNEYLTMKELECQHIDIITNNNDKTSKEISEIYNISYSRITRLRRKLTQSTITT